VQPDLGSPGAPVGPVLDEIATAARRVDARAKTGKLLAPDKILPRPDLGAFHDTLGQLRHALLIRFCPAGSVSEAAAGKNQEIQENPKPP
jgi:hypothetical protein